MTTGSPEGERILATLRAEGGTGTVRLQTLLATPVEDVWSTLTDPQRLAHWLGEIEGDLTVGGEYAARYFSSGWEGTGRVEVCEPPGRLRVRSKAPDGPEVVIEADLSADGDRTVLVLEFRGLPLANLAAYGAGNQIHVEDLDGYLAGRPPCDAAARWQQLHPSYQDLAVGLA
jgi:uncharacterized protein YndB with AHSA1/START domain